jgi:hypothetical protein
MLYHPAEFGRCAAQLRSGTLKESVQSSAGSQEGSHRNDSSAVVSRGWNTRKRTVKRARSPATARRSGSRAHTPGTTPSGASVVCATARPDRRDRLPRPARLRGTFSGCKRSATIDNGVDLDNEEQGAPGDRRLVGEALAAAALAQPPDARTSGDASTRDANAEAHLRNVDGSGTAEAGA